MQKKLIYTCFLILPYCSFAQQAYRVIYERKDERLMSYSINGHRPSVKLNQLYHLVFNDSMAFRYVTGHTRIRPLNIKADMHDHFHHSSFIFKTTGAVFHSVRDQETRKRYFISDSVTDGTWFIDTVIKKFMDWRCREAFTVSNTGDTLFTLLAIDFPYPYAPFTKQRFPFLPLELYSDNSGIHLVVKRIEQVACKLQLPAGVPLISRKEWDALH